MQHHTLNWTVDSFSCFFLSRFNGGWVGVHSTFVKTKCSGMVVEFVWSVF